MNRALMKSHSPICLVSFSPASFFIKFAHRTR